MAGHVRRRGNRWQARYPDPAGRSKTAKIEKTFRTKREAEDWLVAQQASVLAGSHINPRQAERPFADVLAAWKESWAGRLSPTTERRYESIISKYLTPEFGSRRVVSITHEVVQRWVNRLAGDRTIAPGTTRNAYAVLRTAMSYAVRIGVAKVNPCVSINLPRARGQEMLFLTHDEVRAVAETIDPHYRVLVYLAANTGLRAGELAGLQRRDVDLLRGVVHVRRALKDVNGRLELGDTKTHAQRTVSLSPKLRAMLANHLAQPSPDGNGPESFVFTMKGGGPLRMGLVHSRYFRRAVRGYKLRGKQIPGALPAAKANLRFHDLRHTCAALLIAEGTHPKLISARLGHSSVTITLDRYGHVFPSMEEALAEKLDAMFDDAAPLSNVAELPR